MEPNVLPEKASNAFPLDVRKNRSMVPLADAAPAGGKNTFVPRSFNVTLNACFAYQDAESAAQVSGVPHSLQRSRQP